MQKTEIWAVEYSRIAQFFRCQPDVIPAEGGFEFGACRISVAALEDRRFGGMRLPRTQVSFEGEEAPLNAIYRRFFLEFLSARG